MKSEYKLSLALGVFLVYFVLMGIVWLPRLDLHLMAFLILALGIIFRRGAVFLAKELKVILPLLAAWIAVYSLFALIGIKPLEQEADAWHYWLGYGSVRAMVLINLLLLVQLISSFLSWGDILALPLGIKSLRYLMLGRALYETAFEKDNKLSLFLELIPSNQRRGSKISKAFRLKLAYLLALIYIVISESSRKGELIDNRIMHCHRSK